MDAGFEHFQEHPRFGRGPRRTGADPRPTADGSVYLHWHSPEGVRVPWTAIAADTRRQVEATLPVTHYFDSRRTCRDCDRPFLFFAEEQRYWYEELGFRLEVDCVRCVPCRKRSRDIARTRARYEELHGTERDAEADLELAECLATLIEAGEFGPRAPERLRAIVARLPDGSRKDALAGRPDRSRDTVVDDASAAHRGDS